MYGVSRPPNRLTEFKSGGKIVRPRRATTPRPTPYDRPTPRLSPDSTPQNPNWLSRLIFSPSRLLANGAGKVFSSVFGSESSDSSSGDEDDDEDSDAVSTSEGEMEDTIEDGDEGSASSLSGEKKNQTTEIVHYSKKDLPAVEWRTGTMRLIAQLLTQETFTREECDRLTHIIKSRVVDSPIIRGTEDGRLSEVLDKTAGDVMIQMSTHLISAIQLLKRLKNGLRGRNWGQIQSQWSVESALSTLLHMLVILVTEEEAGSPVDLAKSYMQARPLWASPSTNHIQLQSPSSMGKELFKEATPFSVGGKSLSPSKLNWDSPVTGSWNIQEELRKVRSRATEEMLRTRPSSKIDWSALASVYKGGPSLLCTGEVGGAKDKFSNFTQLVDVPLTWGSAATTSGLTDSQMAQDKLQNEAFPPNAATSVPEKSQDLGSTPTIECRAGLPDGSEAISSHVQQQQLSEEVIVKQSADANIAAPAPAPGLGDVEETSHPSSSMAETVRGKSFKSDSMLLEVNYIASKEVAGRDDAFTTNGCPSSAYSLPAVHYGEQKSMLSGKEHSLVGPDHDKVTRTAPGEETCELLSEASMEVPNDNEIVGFANDSEDSSSMYQGGLVQAVARPNPKRRSVSRTTGAKQQGRNVRSRDNRRGRGRGK
ncbi:protein KAKU4 isoform X1 [Populus trichocarpa]|uniref:protein KAKU4 isoform X1 n=1 Tax=Populus trichocarpa TaxID=3694 RepID=UPI000D18B026|nr:protein KAKU4 isoform X1 [Populus trichocarpa]|eukprot:XP_024445656.1 protein KAKU4 isoform X1 [Populus trichocarpa]